jgi:hypothetical protein
VAPVCRRGSHWTFLDREPFAYQSSDRCQPVWRRSIPRIPIRGHGVIIISRRGSRSLKRERQVSSSAAHYDGITGSTGALWTDLQLNDQSLSRGSSRVSPLCCHCACPISIRRAVGTCAGSSLNVRWYLTSGAGRRYQSEYHRAPRLAERVVQSAITRGRGVRSS